MKKTVVVISFVLCIIVFIMGCASTKKTGTNVGLS